ncbi:MAG: chemotaxis protein CheA [Rhodocyclaceae bacterium]
MSEFEGMEELLRDFLTEAGELLSGVDNKLVELEKNPGDPGLLNDIFRGFHTIKGGAGFLEAGELVSLCHLSENLLDKLRKAELAASPEVLDVILAATAAVREMFGSLERGVRPGAADEKLVAELKLAIAGSLPARAARSSPGGDGPACAQPGPPSGPDWDALYTSVTAAPGAAPAVTPPACFGPMDAAPGVPGETRWGRRAGDRPGASAPAGRREGERVAESSIRVDTARLDQVLNLTGEIGLARNRLSALRAEILAGKLGPDTLNALDVAVSQLDLLVSDLQSAAMKTRMQPIGRLFQKYPRIVRDLARSLGKEVEIELSGEETEIDKTMIEDLADPLVHLVRNAVDHGVELPAERAAAGKPERSRIRLEARQEGDTIVIAVSDDGRGMSAERIRAKALQQGLIRKEDADTLDEQASFELIFLPGFSTADRVSAVSGRGVGMDVVRTNIRKLNGTIELRSEPGKGTSVVLSLPLTLAIVPVLLVRLDGQPYAIPLGLVREMLPIGESDIREVGGRAAIALREEVLPVVPLGLLIGRPQRGCPRYGVVMRSADAAFVLAVDGFDGREDAVIKPLESFRPKGVAGVTTLANGCIALILDFKELLGARAGLPRVRRSALLAPVREAA